MSARADRRDVLGYRVRAQQLDRAPDSQPPTAAAILDLGVQDSGTDAASWSLANRGARMPNAIALQESEEFALAWTLRGAPHFYRRAELPDIQTATSPYSDADAAKRIYDANRPLKAAGISAREALAVIAQKMRSLGAAPMAKGEMSAALTQRLTAPYLRSCRVCQAVHPYEMPFRLAALHAGIELQPGTSPPILRPVPGWPERPAEPASDPDAAPQTLWPIRAYLRLLGPAKPAEVAAFLDAPVADVKKRWPPDATEVTVDEETLWALGSDLQVPTDPVVRLLGPFDLFLQAKDRHRLVPDASRHKQLWPILGRPGALLAGTEVVGVWRPRAAGGKFSVRLDPWQKLSPSIRLQVEEQAARLASHRGLVFTGVI
ncbi:MAG TPA: crosslink repair DNA glycosylase YcaQ family protein [Propionibacteriaceae bacterium]|nr:crosslink repair DNA glycosylase YcaQ family protein [Propionibacteriaceae bacterium]